jgi:NAD(P)-dependent dehydrogenase (short-subunit alcohol dehydrogenase family)
LTISSTLVTGANRGIGLGIAECCLVNGAEKIYSIDITQPGDEFQILSKRFPGRLFSATADVTKEDSIQAAVDTIISEAGALHGMVVNAGRTNHKSALDFTQAEIEALFNVNVGYLLSQRGWLLLT